MSGAEHQNGRPLGPGPAQEDKNSAVDVVVCTKRADGHIKISTPMYFDPACSNEPAWGPENERAHNFLAANILYGFLQGDAIPANIRTHLTTLTSRIHDPLDLDRQQETRTYLLSISRAFSEDFISSMDPGEAIIPADQIHNWLKRTVNVPQPISESEPIDEQCDCYPVDASQELNTMPFHDCGFVAVRRKKAPTYNIAQTIWLQRHLRMDWRGPTAACETLAANVIDRFIDSQPPRGRIRIEINGNVGDFYTPFTDDFLHTMPLDGGHIPVSVMTRWFTRHL